MRGLIIVVVLIIAALVAGWIRVSRTGESATIELDGAEVRSDTQQIVDEGRELLDRSPVTVSEDEKDTSNPATPAQP